MPDLDHPFLQNRVVILNGFSNDEILAIMRTVKGLCTNNGTANNGPPLPAIQSAAGDLIFAKTTAKSLQSVLGDLIIDMSGDHAYLKANPPSALKSTP
jgi:hypothetical protein